MKLHLPKQLFTALLAAITLAAPAAKGLTITGSGSLEAITLNADEAYQGYNVTYTLGDSVGTLTKNGGNWGNSLTLKFTLNDNAVSSCTSSTGLVYANAANAANIGLQLHDKDNDGVVELTGRWNSGYWDNAGNTFSEIVQGATYTLELSMGNATNWTDGSDTTYTASGLNTSDSSFSNVVYNKTYVDTFEVQEFANVTVSNAGGTWSQEFNREAVVNATTARYQIGGTDGAAAPDAGKTIVVGGSGQLFLQTHQGSDITLNNNIILGATTHSDGTTYGTLRFGNDGGYITTINGNITIVEDVLMAATNANNAINLNGTVTGDYTLRLKGVGFNFAGAVDIKGLTLEEGTRATFSDLTIDSTITGSGALKLTGALKITDISALDDFAYTYADGATSGFRAGVSAKLFGGTIEQGDNFSISITNNTFNATNLQLTEGMVTGDCSTSDVYDVNEAMDYNAATMGTASLIQVNAAGSLTFAAGETTSVSITNLGNVNLAQGEAAVNINTLLGNYSNIANADGNITVSTTGVVSQSANLAVTGAITVNGASEYKNNGYEITGSNLVLKDVASATLSGARKVKNNLVLNGTNLTFSGDEVVDWGTSNLNWKVLNESTLNLAGTRQTFANGFNLLLDNARVIGSATHQWGHLDFISGATITVLSDSEINAQLRLRSKSVTINVADGKSLTISNTIRDEENGQTQDGGFTKTGSGTLILTAANTYGSASNGGTTISEGVLELQGEGTLGEGATTIAEGATLRVKVEENATKTLNSSVSGGGEVQKSGSGTLTLSGANTYTGGTTVQEGELIVSSAGSLGTGSVQLEAGSTLTLDASVTNAILVNGAGAEIKLSNSASLNHSTGVTTNNDAKVAYTVNSGSTLSISKDANTSNIESLNIAGGKVMLSAWNGSLGSSEDAVDMTLSNDGMFSFTNGNSDSNGGKMYLDIVVNGSGKLAGSNYGGSSNIIGTITSNGDSVHDTLKLGKDANNNWWTISATIKDHDNGADKLAVQKVDDINVVLSGTNTYTGGTVIDAGELRTQNTSALGTGAVQLNGSGVLRVFDALTISELNSTSATTVVTTGTGAATLTVSAGEFAGALKDFVAHSNFDGVAEGAHALSLVKTGSGTLTLSGANTYTGTTTINGGKLLLNLGQVEGVNRDYTLLNTVSGSGTLQVESGTTLLNNGKRISSKLVLNGGNATISGGQTLSADVTLEAGSTLTFSNGDAVHYNKDTAINFVVKSGATVDFGTTRQAFTGGSILELAGGKVTGVGDGYGAIDMKDGATFTIKATQDSEMDATVRLRDGATIKFDVADGKTLTAKGVLKNRDTDVSHMGKFTKIGSGELVLEAANTYTGGTTIEAGTVTTKNAAALGTGGVTMTGGILNVTDVADADTDLTVGGAIVMNADATAKLATTGTTLSLGTAGSVKKSNADGQYVTIASDGTNAASMTAKADNAQLVQLQEDASFTIQDMTLTNTTITAATVETKVKLQNVTATNLALAQGKFTMNAAPTVGDGGTTAEFGSGVVSKLTAGSASLTLNLDVIGAYESTGAVDNVTLTITLAGVTGDVSGYDVDAWKALVGFEESSWLGQALTGAQFSVADVATAAESGVPSVNYGYAATGGEGSNVGTLTITITGLNVPEPASATLGLAALMMLCARRRRKA